MNAAQPGPPLPSGWPDEHRECQREAVAGAAALMRDLLDQVRDRLRSRVPGRSTALRQLDRFAPLLVDGFQARMADAVRMPSRAPSSFGWPALSGADAAESRRYKAETGAADVQFAEFDMLWVAAVPLEAVGRQPLHPAGYLAALQAAVELADVRPELHRRWLRHLRSALPGRLVGVYLRLAAGLEAAGVQPTSVEERQAAQAVAVSHTISPPVDLVTFSARFSQLFEQTLPPDSAFGHSDRVERALPQRSEARVQAGPPPAGAPWSASRSSGPAAVRPAAPPAGVVRTSAPGVAPVPELREASAATAVPSAPGLPAEGAWLELIDDDASADAPLQAQPWQAWQVVWQGAGGRLWLLRDADGRNRSLTRAVLLRLQRAGRLRLR